MKVIDDAVLQAFRESGRCEYCLRATPGGCHPHHWYARGFGGGSRLDIRINLIALCWHCHRLVHDGHVPREELLEIIAKREGLEPEEVERRIFEKLRTKKGEAA